MATDGLGLAISADSHVIEPPDAWASYLDPKFRDRAPAVVHGDDTDKVVCDGMDLFPVGLLAGCARGDDEVRMEGRWDEDIMPAAYDPDARLQDMDRDGVYGEVIYPTLAMRAFEFEGLDYQWALVKAYNDWLADFCAAHPDRLKGVGILIPDDVANAVGELERCREKGLSAALVPLFADQELPYWSDAYTDLWAAAEATETPIGFHAFTSRSRDKSFEKDSTIDAVVNRTVEPQRVIAGMILSGVFDRYPRLKFVSAENDAGWAGNLLERLDFFYHRHQRNRYGADINCAEEPSTIFRRNVFLTFMRDETSVQAHKVIGVENILWSSDFPHNNSTWPNSQEIIKQHYEHAAIGIEDMSKIVRDNARRLYDFPAPEAVVPTGNGGPS